MPERVRLSPAISSPQDKKAKSSKQVRGRPFKPGNPGRPQGSRNKSTLFWEQMVASEGEAILRKVIEGALAGDAKCLQLCLNQLLPRRHGRPVQFRLPELQTPHDLVQASRAVANAVGNQELTPDEAAQLVTVLERYANLIKVVDHESRLDAIEKGQSEKRGAA